MMGYFNIHGLNDKIPPLVNKLCREAYLERSGDVSTKSAVAEALDRSQNHAVEVQNKLIPKQHTFGRS